ncbi:hypothetical protein TEQG_00762 [Trichophyton equinum CBS 127.97]|uniref:SAC domain-containing protein n=1 Tax=Trichophyton equinum (strain ATCC MYA-4606 / CBS 127.97) TaxID=559882 RepID=F2PIF6_TRIEC|nr:hypothetical protein TEQG_00762 [Trichophyton equinum CBS 127.97]
MSPNLPFRDINLYASPHCYAFRSASASTAHSLVIDRPTGDLRLEKASTHQAKRVSSIAGILGIVKLKLDKYVIVITKEQPMGRLRGHMVYKVVATEFLPLRETPLHDPDEDAYLALLKKLLATGPMYYSYSLDITNSFQRQSQSDLSLPLWKRADDRFFWNRFIQTDLIDFSTGLSENTGIRSGQSSDVDPYILPVMFGMLRITTAKIKSTPFTFALITRRSRFRAGTRYFSRGIDEHGNVSNYNETEQIAILNDSNGAVSGFAGGVGIGDSKIGEKSHKELQVLSFVQTRGSIPVYWAEVNNLHYTPKLAVRGVDAASSAARKHFSDQIKTYGENFLVNLVNQKGREEQMKRAALMDRLHYIYFDFHNETKGLQWHRAELLLNQLNEGLQRGQYFSGIESLGNPSGTLEARRMQSSVVRTNCMDCLDRTNVVQSMLGRYTLTRQFIDCGILMPGEKTDDDLVFRDLFRNIQDAFDLFHGTYLPSSTASYVFADRRPLVIQSIPYILGAAIFMILVATFTRQLPDSTGWPLRIFLIFWIVVAAWCLNFIHSHGMLYVNWPKLNTPATGAEGYAEALRRASKDKLIGDFIPTTGRQRGVSNARLGFMEEGKKRIE